MALKPPPPWEVHHTEEGEQYYWNPETNLTTWDFPVPEQAPQQQQMMGSSSGSGAGADAHLPEGMRKRNVNVPSSSGSSDSPRPSLLTSSMKEAILTGLGRSVHPFA